MLVGFSHYFAVILMNLKFDLHFKELIHVKTGIKVAAVVFMTLKEKPAYMFSSIGYDAKQFGHICRSSVTVC